MTKEFLENFWYIACQSSDVKEKPVSREILGKKIVLFRDKNKRLGAVVDRCTHRNMALSRGKVTEDGLQCVYHGWAYDTAGKCTNIPAACSNSKSGDKKNGKKCSSTGVRIASFPVSEKQGLIWIYMGKGKPTSRPIDLPMFKNKHWQHWIMERDFDGEAIHCCENFLDVPHTVFVHDVLFRTQNHKPEKTDFMVTGGESWVQAEFINEKPMDSLVGRLLIPKGSKMKHTDKFMLPYTTRVDYQFNKKRNFIVMSHCTPVNAETTHTYTYMAFRFDPISPLVKMIYKPLSNIILDQDVRLIKKQTADINNTGKKSFLYHPSDAIGREIADLVAGKKLELSDGGERRNFLI